MPKDGWHPCHETLEDTKDRDGGAIYPNTVGANIAYTV